VNIDRVVAQDPVQDGAHALPRRKLATANALALQVGLAVWLLGCASAGTSEPPAWASPTFYASDASDPPAWASPTFFYWFTRKAALDARGPAPALVVRLSSARLPEPVLLVSAIPPSIHGDAEIQALPFLPTPDRELRMPAPLEGCAEVVVFANPDANGAGADALAPGKDVVLTPLPAESWAALPAEPCAMVLRYGTTPDRKGTWLRVVTHAGVVSEYLVAVPKPGYWVLVPFAAVAETTVYAVSFVLFLALVALPIAARGLG